MTGLKDNQGRSGGFENLGINFNKWDSGASPPKDLRGRKIGNGLNY